MILDLFVAQRHRRNANATFPAKGGGTADQTTRYAVESRPNGASE